MSRRVWTLIGAGCVAAGMAVAFAGGKEEPSGLAEEVRSLRKRVEALEKRLQALDPKAPSQVPLEFLVPPQGSTLPNLPPGTQQREFNGMTYYIIPIQQGAAAAPAATAQDR